LSTAISYVDKPLISVDLNRSATKQDIRLVHVTRHFADQVLKKFREDINGYDDENYENEITQGLSQLNIFISSIEIHKEKRKELEEIMELIQTGTQKLIVNIIVIFVFIYSIFIL
jgi:hypothetical protein